MPLPARLSDAVVKVLYLHGFASSPGSTKVGYFTERFRERGIDVHAPDFNQPEFRTLTLTRMLDQLSAALTTTPGAATLIGSSLGGTLAILAAANNPTRVERLVLMAPAVMFAKPGHHLLPPERVDEWRRRGALPFFHYAYNEERDLNVEFYEDSLQHDAFGAAFSQPTLIFQGMRDASVDYRTVEAFAQGRSNVTLSLLDDDHQLIASLPRMWTDMRAFLELDT
ncbi:MAG TPA: YqiA/YcfP family alpha/beta fold hydrolase [Vicinamibacterales bacterium]|nr:YqiA/YcfP family alpha/beta fold hydrolase [Vicinamibacterales bacterium]